MDSFDLNTRYWSLHTPTYLLGLEMFDEYIVSELFKLRSSKNVAFIGKFFLCVPTHYILIIFANITIQCVMYLFFSIIHFILFFKSKNIFFVHTVYKQNAIDDYHWSQVGKTVATTR